MEFTKNTITISNDYQRVGQSLKVLSAVTDHLRSHHAILPALPLITGPLSVFFHHPDHKPDLVIHIGVSYTPPAPPVTVTDNVVKVNYVSDQDHYSCQCEQDTSPEDYAQFLTEFLKLNNLEIVKKEDPALSPELNEPTQTPPAPLLPGESESSTTNPTVQNDQSIIDLSAKFFGIELEATPIQPENPMTDLQLDPKLLIEV
ncbi:MAG: hypothetical protein SFT81_05290 [Candidatus Caenarcaniphilales bacterium]|nr:hypothetical protein [Candidatus Caenarcaniphilales bacterium]